MEERLLGEKKLEGKEGKNKRRKWRAPPKIEGRPLIQNGKGEEKKMLRGYGSHVGGMGMRESG